MRPVDIKEMRVTLTKNDAKRDAGLVEPEQLVKERDLSYGPHGKDNLLDVYYPDGPTDKLPVIVSIHGGGFFYGDKELYRFYTMNLAKSGFVVINFNYRLAPEHLYPAALEDTNNVLNWLVEKQAEYPIDLTNLFIVGDSAGAQLAAQYATMLTNPAYSSLFDFPMAPVTVKGLGLNCGLYFIGQSEAIDAERQFYFGEPLTEDVKRQFPVEAFMTADFPATSITTATDDFLKGSAEPLAALLQKQGVPTAYHLYAEPTGKELYHVFHIDQYSDIGKKCNADQLAFFTQLKHN